jgi:hypothetical protein
MIETLQEELKTAREEKSRMLDLLEAEQRHRRIMLEFNRPKRLEGVWPRLKSWLQDMHLLREG